MSTSSTVSTPASPDDAPAGRLTRTEVARRLGVSLTTLRRMEGKTLHPVLGPGGVRFFNETEVEAVQITYRRVRTQPDRGADETEGVEAAEAFERSIKASTPSTS